MNSESLNPIYKEVEGFLMDEEAQILFSLALDDSLKGAVVEIGSWKGKSTVVLAQAVKQKGAGKVYAIDPHTGSPEHGKVWTFTEFENNLKKAGVADAVVPIVKTSEEAVKGWKEPVRLLWIDGNHEYDFAKSDFLLWEPHVMEGGVVAFHDTVWAEGVNRVIKEYFFSSEHFKKFRFAGNIVCAEKSSNVSFKERLENCLFKLYWKVYAFRTKMG